MKKLSTISGKNKKELKGDCQDAKVLEDLSSSGRCNRLFFGNDCDAFCSTEDQFPSRPINMFNGLRESVL